MERKSLFKIISSQLFLLALHITQSLTMIKKIIFFIACLSCTCFSSAQESYTVNGESIILKTEVDGTMDLLWTIIDNRYRYFVRMEDEIMELVNTKGPNNKFQEEYKNVLGLLANDSQAADKVKFTLYGLRTFIDTYNAEADTNYVATTKNAEVQARLLIFGGITNSPFTNNPDNKTNPLAGLEIEVFEASNLPRHSLFFQSKHVFKSDEFKYSNTQLGLGYRFRIIKHEAVNFYANMIFSTYNFTNSEFVLDGETIEQSKNAFDTPFIFGVGVDIRISKNSFITLAYDELFALFKENQGNFSTHLSIGYKLNL